MALSEFEEQLLKKLDVAGPLNPSDLLKIVFGLKEQPPVDDKIQDLRSSILESANTISSEIKEVSKDKESILHDILGFPKGSVNTTPLTVLRQETWNQIEEAQKKIKETVSFSSEQMQQMLDIKASAKEKYEDIKKHLERSYVMDFAAPAPKPTPLEVVGEDLKYAPKKKEATPEQVIKIDPELTNYLKALLPKFDGVLDSLAPKKEFNIDIEKFGDKFDDIIKATGIKKDTLEEFFELAKAQKQKDSDPSIKLYNPEEKPISLNEKQFSSIVGLLNLTKEEENKLLDQILQTQKEQLKEQKEANLGLTGILAGLGLGATGLIGGAVAGLLGSLASLGVVIAGIMATFAVFGKPLAQLSDKFLGTNFQPLVNKVRKDTKLDTVRGENIAKYTLLGALGAKNALQTIPRTFTKIGKRGLVREGLKYSKASAANRGAVVNTGKTIIDRVKAIKSGAKTAETATTVVKGGGMLSKAFASYSKLFTPFITGLGKGLLRKIPIIGAVFDLGIAWDQFSKGNNAQGIISLLSAASNLLYLLGPEMFPIVLGIQAGLGILSWFLGDSNTEGGEGNQEAPKGETNKKPGGVMNSLKEFFGPKRTLRQPKPENEKTQSEASVANSDTIKAANQIAQQEMEDVTVIEADGTTRTEKRPKLTDLEGKEVKRYSLSPIPSTTPPPAGPTLKEISPLVAPVPTFISLDDDSIERLSTSMRESNGDSSISINSEDGGGGGGGSSGSSRDQIHEHRTRIKPAHYWNVLSPAY